MAKIIHISCPCCGGTLGLKQVDRVVECRYCGKSSLVEGVEIVPEYYFEPELDRAAVLRRVHEFLADPDFPDDLGRRAVIEAGALFFVPFYELTAKRTGLITLTKVKYKKRRMALASHEKDDSYLLPREIDQVVTDTQVVMGDVYHLEPAVSLDGWSLRESDLEQARNNGGRPLLPLDRSAMIRKGKIFTPMVDPVRVSDFVALNSKDKNVLYQTELTEPRVKLIFHPVWRVRYRCQGRLYGVTLDGVTGKVMRGRAPQNEKGRAFWLTLFTAVVALPAGSVLGKVGSGLVQSMTELTWRSFKSNLGWHPLLGALAVIILFSPWIGYGVMNGLKVLAQGWDSFRYQGIFLVVGQNRSLIKVNRPSRTSLEKAVAFMERFLK